MKKTEAVAFISLAISYKIKIRAQQRQSNSPKVYLQLDYRFSFQLLFNQMCQSVDLFEGILENLHI